MKRRTRIIISIVFLLTSLLSSFYFLPKESELYLKSDISELRSSILPISILLSIVLAFIIAFHKSEFNGGKWSKVIYIGYIGITSYLILSLTSDLLTTIALKTNRITKNETVNKNFVMSTYTVTTNGELTESGPWVIKSENKYEVRGRIKDKSYEDDVDGIFMDKNDYAKIEHKEEFKITLSNGLFGIPYEPIINE
ncbi:hypothetical protein BTO05_13625 [Winogradskyella sp. PC-19]|uniref:hypothetical protein n=1 Tax=Winogradskyella sp. PC-19 TaxID=754417 RepID=UPI000B3CF503|nr:hypothetical protein [Winogradskyella sp. PC-19]ARV10623.1 hypothetical protein BTO05_13625 [Winogradskyella sp. PC-19]